MVRPFGIGRDKPVHCPGAFEVIRALIDGGGVVSISSVDLAAGTYTVTSRAILNTPKRMVNGRITNIGGESDESLS